MSRTPPPATTPSFEKSAKPLLLTLKPSRTFRLFLFVLHGLCIAALFIAAIPVGVKLLLAIVIVASLVYHLKQQAIAPQLIWRNANRWFVDDEQAAVELSSINFFSQWLVIISLSEGKDGARKKGSAAVFGRFNRTRKFIIPFDSLTKESFRLLRVRLRIEGYELLNPPAETIR